MTRLSLFISALVLIVVVMSFRFFNNIKIDNNKFNYQSSKEKFEAIEMAISQSQKLKEKSLDEVEEIKEPVVKDIVIALDTPELINGANLYKNCISCHGKNAEGKKSQKAPKLAGQYNWYLESQIVNMKNKERVNAIMDPYIKKLSEQDIKDVSLYISQFPW